MGFDPRNGHIRPLLSRDELRPGEIVIDNREKRRLERVAPERRARTLERMRRPDGRHAWLNPDREQGRGRRKRREARDRAGVA